MNIKEIIERVSAFDDSQEVADGLYTSSSQVKGEYPYYAKEGVVQIEGLYDLALELKSALELQEQVIKHLIKELKG